MAAESDPLVRAPFAVFVWVAEAGSPVSAGNAASFQRMLADPKWCKSTAARAAVPKTREAYPQLWKAHAARATPPAEPEFQAAIRAAMDAAPEADRALLAQDLLAVADGVARGRGGASLLGRVRPLAQPVKRAIETLRRVLDESSRARSPAAAATAAAATTPREPAVVRAPVDDSFPSPSCADVGDFRQLMPLLGADASMLLRWSGGRIQLRCARIIPETADVKTFRFVGLSPVLFSHKPGQFLTLELNVDGRRVVRSYTIASPPSRPHCLEITVKRTENGLVSNYLHDQLKAGDTVTVLGCAGKFNCWDLPARKMLLISAGSGITPCMSMARWLNDTESTCDVVFLHSARGPDDIIFRRELELMAARNENFRLAVTCTRPTSGQPWSGYTGRLSTELLTVMCPDALQRTVYTCGPAPFMESTREILRQIGLPAARYHEESFGGRKERGADTRVPTAEPVAVSPAAPPAAPPSASAPSKPFTVLFTVSGKTVCCGPDDRILELAESQGVAVPSSCRSGLCGTCKTVKESGAVESERCDGLTDSERAAGYILTCVSRPASNVVLQV